MRNLMQNKSQIDITVCEEHTHTYTIYTPFNTDNKYILTCGHVGTLVH